MKTLKLAGAAFALLLAAACDVTVNNESVEDQADALGERIENVAERAGNTVDSAADAIENKADQIGDIDVDVNLGGDGDTQDANTNRT